MDDLRALADARAALAAAAAELAAAGVRPEQLAVTVAAHRVLGLIPRRATMRRTGEGWRLGALLVTSDGETLEPCTVIRASRAVLPGQQAESAQKRRALRLMALDAGFAEGDVIALDPRRIPIDDLEAMLAESHPLVLRDGCVLVRWMPEAPDESLAPLRVYLREHLELAGVRSPSTDT